MLRLTSVRPPLRYTVPAWPAASVPMVRLAFASVVPVPLMVPPVQTSGPLTVTVPAPLSVPPAVMLRGPPRVEAEAIERPPLEMVSPAPELVVTLLTESLSAPLTLTVPEFKLITASSLGPGTTPPIQLLATSQLPPLATCALFQVMVERTVRSSRCSIKRGLGRGRRRPAASALTDFKRRRGLTKLLMIVISLEASSSCAWWRSAGESLIKLNRLRRSRPECPFENRFDIETGAIPGC